MTPILTLLTLATVLPLFSSVCVIFLGKKVGRLAAWAATGVMGLCFLLSAAALVMWISQPDQTPQVWRIPWIPVPGSSAQWLYLGALVDGLTVAMMTMVTMISTLVHLYSVGYMEGDKRFTRFFAYLSLFTFSMLGIVMSNSLMQLFVFWELVGLTSYLLIGFWFEKRGPQLACKKAFVMNRVGDAGFLIGFGILFYKLGASVLLPAAEGVTDTAGNPVLTMLGALQAVLAQESVAAGLHGAAAYTILNPPLWLTIAGIGIFFGAIGKSAQFPLHTWLPDAMEGPTPVSSIVHSATMVAAGVYLTARVYPILTPSAHLFISIIGLITLVMAACMALVMTDIKRVLAYSTLSQLGYMVLGLGAGAYSWALFHLITHAFFKCCLFQCSGSVIHAMHHEQDMRQYGGLKSKMPVTAACYLVCTLAIAGASIPFTPIGISGFYSKDGIIAGTINYGEAMASLGSLANLFWLGPTLVAYLTVFYMTRSFMLTFWGAPRNQEKHDHAHEAPWTMLVPQVVLAVMAIVSIPPVWLPLINATGLATATTGRFAELDITWAQPGSEEAMYHGFHLTHLYLLNGLGWIVSMAAGFLIYRNGLGLASRIAALPGLRLLHKWALNKFYFDALYDVFFVFVSKLVAHACRLFDTYVVDGVVNLSGLITKVAAFATGGFDLKVVDGAVNGAATVAQSGGQLLRNTQVGRVRVYVLLMFCTAVVATLVVVVAATT